MKLVNCQLNYKFLNELALRCGKIFSIVIQFFFLRHGSALTWSLTTVRYEAAHLRLAKADQYGGFLVIEYKSSKNLRYYNKIYADGSLVNGQVFYRTIMKALFIMILSSLFVGVGSKWEEMKKFIQHETYLHTLI